MARPWSYPPVRKDYEAAAGVLVLISQAQDTSTLLNDITPGETIVVPAGALVPPAVVHVTDDYLLIAVGGTQGFLQWVCHFLGSNQVQAAPFPGRVNVYFASAANSLLAALSEFEPLLETRRLVLLGHSFGGAIVQLVATSWQGMATRGVTCITFGSPRVGNQGFADGVTNPPFRVQHDGDVVPSFPPAAWAGVGTPWTGFVNLIPAIYVHSGTLVSLDDAGQVGTTDNTMSFASAVTVAASGEFDPHLIEEYQRLLSLEPGPPEIEWEDPPAVEAYLQWEASFFNPSGSPDLGGGGMLTQGIMYFKTSEETSGWGESWASGTDISGMLNKLATLAKERANCLANACTIFAYKAANIDPARTTNASRSIILDNPIKGKASGTSSVDLPNTATNETMDCIDYELQSTTNTARRIFPFRGVPDSWIMGSTRTGDGIGADKRFQNYFAEAKNLTLGFKVYDRTQPRKPLTTVANDPVTGLLMVTSAGHGLTDRQLITIRAFKPNPMINGQWRVGGITPNTFLLVGSDKFQADGTGVGTYQLRNVVADTIESAFYNSVSTRKIGRVFGQRRGRRSARLLHH